MLSATNKLFNYYCFIFAIDFYIIYHRKKFRFVTIRGVPVCENVISSLIFGQDFWANVNQNIPHVGTRRNKFSYQNQAKFFFFCLHVKSYLAKTTSNNFTSKRLLFLGGERGKGNFFKYFFEFLVLGQQHILVRLWS
jgi:hypothetical protein